jgi:hypothetical protein
MQDFEKLGAFYLGRQIDPLTNERDEDLVLYDSRDLTTHAVIIGMTGSGKTGLGIGLIEEAALDRIPVLAIDPKGDLGNLLLAFPRLRGSDFEPWIDARTALDAGATVAEHARDTAKLWRDGLERWGQAPARIAKYTDGTERRIYTPGSSAGISLSVLASLEPPATEVSEDDELYRELIDATASSLLALLDIQADPLTSREHIYLSMVIDSHWREGKALSLAALIAALQSPPFDRVGIVDLETFYPSKERFALAMRFNNLLAAPRFRSWLEGVPLDIDSMLHGPTGKPAVSVVSIAHLDDTERMFVVTLLLSQLVAWMRKQAGSSSLRAILYMDEVFGFMPPLGNPPSKRLLLTLMKQARAYGLGVVLATQNPVDLDYKGLSNAGTWFLGRLQTERDKARVVEGLRSAAGSAALEGIDLDDLLSSLGKRRFLLHNVHETAPLLFETRWVMSYLAGPLTRDQIRQLTPATRAAPGVEPVAPGAAPVTPGVAPVTPRAMPAPADNERDDSTRPSTTPGLPQAAAMGRASATRPVLTPSIEQRFLPLPTGRDGRIVYVPRLLAVGELGYVSKRLSIDEVRPFALALEVDDDTSVLDWTAAESLDLVADDLATDPEAGSDFAECPAPLARAGNYRSWKAKLKRALREQYPIVIYKSRALKLSSTPGESERDFRIRLQEAGREQRDEKAARLKSSYASKAARLEERLRRALQAVEREREQAQERKLDAAVSFGTAVLGALLGRKVISATSASRVGTAVRKAGRASKESGDIARAEETAEAVRSEIEALEEQLQADIDALDAAYDAQLDELETVTVKPASTAIHIDLLGIGWEPFVRDRQ